MSEGGHGLGGSGPWQGGGSELQPSRLRARGLTVALALAVGLVTAWVHWPALSAKTVLFDDQQYLTSNYLVRNPSWASARQFLGEVLDPSTVEGYYQPLAMISLMLDCAMGGRPEHLMPFHRTSLILHAVNTALIILLLYQLFGRPWIAAAVGLLFGVHPLTVEPIAWVSERKTLLAAFFALWCLIVYVRYARRPNWKPYVAGLLFYILALISKPTSTPVPVAMLLLDFWPLNRLGRRTVLEKLPLFVVAAVFSVITMVSQARTGGVLLPDQSSHSAGRILLILGHNIIFYLHKIVWPARLSSHYPFPQPLALSDPMILTGVIGTCILIPALLLSLRWTRALLTGWLIFFVVMFPTMGVLGFTIVIASDRYAYLPMIGLLLIVAWLLGLLWGTAAGSTGILGRRAGSIVAVIAVVALEALATRHCLARWQDQEGYQRYMLALAPNSAHLHSLLGNTLADRGELDEAIEHHLRAVQLKPDLAQAHNNMGIALARQGKLDEAVRHYSEALRLKAAFAEAHNNLASSLFRLGRVDEAIEHYAEALRLKPGYVEARCNLATTLGSQGKYKEAIAQFTEVLELRPDLPEVHNNLGAALSRLGRDDQAMEHFVRAVQLSPEYAEAQNNLGLVLARQGRFDEAIAHFMRALQRSPRDPNALRNLGFSLMSKGRLSDAEAYYQQALESRPDNAEVHNDLGIVLAQQGKLAEAVAHFQEALRLRPGMPQALENLKRYQVQPGAPPGGGAPAHGP